MSLWVRFSSSENDYEVLVYEPESSWLSNGGGLWIDMGSTFMGLVYINDIETDYELIWKEDDD